MSAAAAVVLKRPQIALVSVNVTSLVSGNGQVSLELQNTANNSKVPLASRESGASLAHN